MLLTAVADSPDALLDRAVLHVDASESLGLLNRAVDQIGVVAVGLRTERRLVDMLGAVAPCVVMTPSRRFQPFALRRSDIREHLPLYWTSAIWNVT